MEAIPAITLPDSYINFAKAVGALAASHGITTAQVKITPNWRDGETAQRLHGEVTINYSSKDGRGRPCDNLWIALSANLNVPIISTPESSS